MRKICLSLPTNRECAATILSLADEAAYAVRQFGVEVYLLILDTSDEEAFAENSAAVKNIQKTKHVIPLHLNEEEQCTYFGDVIDYAGVPNPELMRELMLPDRASYGACTNRAFLISSALGCESIHRRDSDSRYQIVNGQKVFPIHHELMSLGKSAAEAKHGVTEIALETKHEHKPVSLVGSSFIGELSVDISEIYRLNKAIYYDVVGLWAAGHCSDAEKKALVEESFTGAGMARFGGDRATLAIVDPMTVDMCNVSFHRVHEQLPLPPATDTIGSDYFLLHAIRHAQLPGVQHNRNIENFYTGERRTDAGFIDYQMRLTKFFLSMLYFHFIYAKMAEAGGTLLDDQHRLITSTIATFARLSTLQDKTENVQRLDAIDRAYRILGGRYAMFADVVASKRQTLLEEAERDIHHFALLIEAWPSLVKAGKSVSLSAPLRVAS